MAILRMLALYAHTIRHMKPRQISGRIGMRIIRPRADVSPAPGLRGLNGGAWREPARLAPSMTGPVRFRFLNEIRDLDESGWDDPQTPLLWRYNLHYFDDLAARGARARKAWHVPLILRWIAQNPPGQGTGWDPYPTSLRIVNWIRWALEGNELPAEAIHSLAVQTRWLMRRLEWHLLGNHLFANAKALVFAGLFFAGDEAERWLRRGLSILGREIPEQILPDGGHFELSPMYHAIACMDMLDLLNILHCLPEDQGGLTAPLRKALEERLPSMLGWLSVMSHPDGEIAFFNDTAIGIAPAPGDIHAYGQRLGMMADKNGGTPGLTHLRDSGYIRINAGPASLFLDVARVGADYIPGHAHADTLSCELSVHGRRLLVNGGISTYAAGHERVKQRGTAMHNTVVVDGEDSSEVWSAFRLARRARPFGLRIAENGGDYIVRCRHDGYGRLCGKPVHERVWRFAAQELVVEDRIVPAHGHTCLARWRFHPAIHLQREDSAWLAVAGGRCRAKITFDASFSRLRQEGWHPGFGMVEPCSVLEAGLMQGASVMRLDWSMWGEGKKCTSFS